MSNDPKASSWSHPFLLPGAGPQHPHKQGDDEAEFRDGHEAEHGRILPTRRASQSRLVTSEKIGRVRTCKLGPRPLEEETTWIERDRQLWASRVDELDEVVGELKPKERVDGRRKRK